jgi:hypothetical protein
VAGELLVKECLDGLDVLELVLGGFLFGLDLFRKCGLEAQDSGGVVGGGGDEALTCRCCMGLLRRVGGVRRPLSGFEKVSW